MRDPDQGGLSQLSQAIKIIVPSEASRAVEAGELQLVDIRLAPDAAADPVGGAVNIPFPELEQRIGEIDSARPVAFICKAGAKSQDAARIASERGYDAASVDGGLIVWNEQAGGGQ
jgi:thiosulfate sulfurtransferase